MSEATLRTETLRGTTNADHLVARWLFAVAAMVFGAVVIGGLTRLTESGLSITDWRPLTGWLPPMSDEAWQATFDGYKRIPEYHAFNAGMTLDEFKGIFWLEYIHRLWGRLIGLVFAVPFVWFAVTRRLDRRLAWILAGLFLLGGVQGGIGWYMVSSGLTDRTDVSQYRLALHLGVALVIYVCLLLTALWLRRSRAPWTAATAGWRSGLWVLLALVGVTVLSGAFVAGLNAGMTYNTFPLMDGVLVPSYLYEGSPIWRAAFEDIATVQFNHRVLAVITFAAIVVAWLVSRRPAETPAVSRSLSVILAAAVLQVTLGIATLLSVVAMELAVLHQAGAVVLITAVVWAVDHIGRGDTRPDR
ncbi:MAG: COX15/CtaA family protein [Rhodospirillales bacterium]